MRFSERLKIFAATESADVTTNGVDGQSIHMGRVHAAAFLINFGAITSDDVLKFYVGATDATKTTAIAFRYRLAAADTKAALSDTFGAFTAVASTGLTLTAATFDHRLVIVEFDSQEIPDATPWLTLETAGSASASNISVVVIAEPRHSGNNGLPTVID